MNEILMYGEIGWEVTAAGVVAELKAAAGEPVTVRISSGGGDVYEGIAIVNALRGYQGEITVVIESLAASAASFIAAGCGGRVVARPNAEVMTHRAWTMQMGNSDDLAKTIGDLERQDTKLAAIYADKTGGSAEEWLDRMAAETWFTAQEALDVGLVDAIEDAKVQAPAASMSKSRVLASCRYASRSAAPPPIASKQGANTTEPSDGRKEKDSMSFDEKLKIFAQSMGVKPEVAKQALAGFFNEVVPITGEVEVSYPADTKMVPTEKIKVAPIVGDKPAETAESSEGDAVAPVENAEESAGDSAAVQLAKSAGLTFSMGDVAEGFTAEVDEGGTVTIKAPSGAEVGSTAEFTVLVNDTAVPLSVTVRSLDEEEEADPATDPVETDSATTTAAQASIPKGFVMIPEAHLNDLNERAKFANSAFEKQKAASREAEVDQWLKEGRFSAGSRQTVIAQHKANPELARETWGKLPKNTIPRAEIGYGVDPAEDGAKTAPTKNPFSKPKV